MLHTLTALFLIMAGQYEIIPYEEAMYALATVMILFASGFYYILFGVIAGLRSIGLNPDMDIKMSVLHKTVEWLCIYALYESGFGLAAGIALPWILITTATDIFAILIITEVIELQPADEEDEEEDL